MKEEFKLFVKKHPELIKYVNNDKMTWQKFYDMYSLYKDDDNAWSDYLNKDIKENKTSVNDVINTIKKIDIDNLQKNVNTINKIIALASSALGAKEVKDEYTPRPIYKKFED